jgi:hypothetical protein
VCASNTYINMCMPARSMCIPASVRSVCNTYVPVSPECIRGCYECTCVVVPNNNGIFISENVDKQKTSNTLSFVLLSAFVLLVTQFSKSKYRHSF